MLGRDWWGWQLDSGDVDERDPIGEVSIQRSSLDPRPQLPRRGLP